MAETIQDIVEETQEIAPDIAEEAVSENAPEAVLEDIPEDIPETVAPKRKPGRPAGARNKGPPKPRAKRVVVSEAVEYAPPPRVEYAPPPSPISLPRWDAQHQPIPTEPHNEMAALMLKLLSGQSMERQRRKDAQRKAWFS
jgi:hypothetical protein